MYAKSHEKKANTWKVTPDSLTFVIETLAFSMFLTLSIEVNQINANFTIHFLIYSCNQ